MKRERKIQEAENSGPKDAKQSQELRTERHEAEPASVQGIQGLDNSTASIRAEETAAQGQQEKKAQDRQDEKALPGWREEKTGQGQPEENSPLRKAEEKTALRQAEGKSGKIREKKTAQSQQEETAAGSGRKAADKEARYQQKLNSLKQGKSRANVIAVIAVVVAVVAVLLCIVFYSAQYNRRLTVIAPVGDITFVDKHKEEDTCFVTFQAADYNRIPSDINTQGITVRVEPEIYDLIAIDINYGSANIVFEVPQGVARKAGYDEEQMNIQNLWTEDILKKYASARSIVWSVAY